jgi:protein TonB
MSPSPVLTPALKRGKVKTKGSGRSYGLIVALLVVAILAAAGYYGFLWWQGRGGDVQTPVAAARPVIAPQPTTAATGSVEQTNTIVELSDTAVTASVTDSAAVSVATTTTSPDLPLPVVTAKAAAPPAPVAEPPRPAPAPVQPKTIPASAVQYLVPPSPTYPAQSKRLGETGRVTVRVFIDEAGNAKDVRVERGSGHSRLDEAALTAVQRARFKPYMENGLPLAGWAFIPIDFGLER